MTASNPAGISRGDRVERGLVPPGSTVEAPDPWGVKRAENLIAGLTGVLSARAAAGCLDDLLPDNSIALEGAQLVEAFDRKFVLVAVHGLGGREAQLLTGTCEIRESAERSAVLAILDATNRWVDARR